MRSLSFILLSSLALASRTPLFCSTNDYGVQVLDEQPSYLEDLLHINTLRLSDFTPNPTLNPTPESILITEYLSLYQRFATLVCRSSSPLLNSSSYVSVVDAYLTKHLTSLEILTSVNSSTVPSSPSNALFATARLEFTVLSLELLPAPSYILFLASYHKSTLESLHSLAKEEDVNSLFQSVRFFFIKKGVDVAKGEVTKGTRVEAYIRIVEQFIWTVTEFYVDRGIPSNTTLAIHTDAPLITRIDAHLHDSSQRLSQAFQDDHSSIVPTLLHEYEAYEALYTVVIKESTNVKSVLRLHWDLFKVHYGACDMRILLDESALFEVDASTICQNLAWYNPHFDLFKNQTLAAINPENSSRRRHLIVEETRSFHGFLLRFKAMLRRNLDAMEGSLGDEDRSGIEKQFLEMGEEIAQRYQRVKWSAKGSVWATIMFGDNHKEK